MVNQQKIRLFSGLFWPRLPYSPRIQAMAMQVPLASTQWWPHEKLVWHQLAQVQTLINHAFSTVPFYRQSLSGFAGQKPGQLTMERYRMLPILSREEVREAGAELISSSLPPGHGSFTNIRTSGSTGQPVEIKGTGASGLMFHSLGLRSHAWHKRDLSLDSMSIRPSDQPLTRSQGWSPGSTGRHIRVAHQRPGPDLFEALMSEDPHYLQCYPTTLRELLRLSSVAGIAPNNLREVRTTSEVLEPELRAQTRDQWGVKVADMYSAEELNMIALQCPDHDSNLHVQMEGLLLEILNDNDEPCQPGEIGRCVVTNLSNFASPLIRYEYGDYAEVGECSCGRGLATLSRVIGRKYNLMILPNGDRLPPAMPPHDALFELPVRQFQLVQTSVTEVEVRVVAARTMTDAEEQRLGDMYKNRMNVPMRFVIRYVDDIPRLASGKFELFRCEIGS